MAAQKMHRTVAGARVPPQNAGERFWSGEHESKAKQIVSPGFRG